MFSVSRQFGRCVTIYAFSARFAVSAGHKITLKRKLHPFILLLIITISAKISVSEEISPLLIADVVLSLFSCGSGAPVTTACRQRQSPKRMRRFLYLTVYHCAPMALPVRRHRTAPNFRRRISFWGSIHDHILFLQSSAEMYQPQSFAAASKTFVRP